MGIAPQDACSGNNEATTPLPPIEINYLYTTGYVIRFRSLRWPSA
jgi:hypothetical protein